MDLAREGNAVFMCPEQAAGFPTPREPDEIEPGKTAKGVLDGKGRVLTKAGLDVIRGFVAGAEATLAVCKDLNIQTAIMKAGSPSCGSVEQYDGAFSGTMIVGSGVTAELLRQNGIRVCGEDNVPAELFI